MSEAIMIQKNSTINGHKFDCGKLSFDTNITEPITINHKLKEVPSVVFFWSDNFPFTSNGIISKIRNEKRSPNNTISVHFNNGSISSVRADFAFDSQKIEFTNSTITIGCDSFFPLLANVEYNWIAIL